MIDAHKRGSDFGAKNNTSRLVRKLAHDQQIAQQHNPVNHEIPLLVAPSVPSAAQENLQQ